MRRPLATRQLEQSPPQVAKEPLNRQMGKDRPIKQREPLQLVRPKLQRQLEEQQVRTKVRLPRE